ATAIATTAATTAAAISAKTAATTAAAPATAAIFSWSVVVYGRVATSQVGTIKLFDCLLSIFLGSHLHETKSARTSCVAVFHNRCRLHCPCLRTQLLQR